MRRLPHIISILALATFGIFVSSQSASATAYDVTTLADAGAGSLRQAIADASADGAGPHTITFSVSGTINVGVVMIYSGDQALTIDGGGNITLDGGDSERIFLSQDAGAAVTLSNIDFTNGAEAAGDGGAINVQGSLSMSAVSVTSSSASGQGGGVHGAAGVTLTGVTVSGNTAGSFGGVSANGALSITSSVISGNNATGNVGGAGSSFGSNVTIAASTVSGNTAGGSFGGVSSDGGNIDIQRSTISGNTAAASGGGVANNGGGITLVDATVANNSAATGASVFGVATNFTARWTVLANPLGGGGHCSGTVIGTVDYSYSTDGTCSFAGGTGGTDNGADPLLGALAANGGAGQTHLPAAGSPLVDAGDLGCSATDQRGTSTPQGAFCDIGSVEVVGGAVATTTTTAAPVTTTTSGGVATTAPPASVAPTVAAGPNFTG